MCEPLQEAEIMYLCFTWDLVYTEYILTMPMCKSIHLSRISTFRLVSSFPVLLALLTYWLVRKAAIHTVVLSPKC